MGYELTRGVRSKVEEFVALPERDRKRMMRAMSDEECLALMYDWRFWARPDQLMPPLEGDDSDWLTWVIIGGRGIGKTRSAGEAALELIKGGYCKYPIFAGADAADVRKVMVEGESGIMNICPPDFMPVYEPSNRRLCFPNGVVAYLFGAGAEPDSLRGPQSDLLWCDEIAKWQYATEAWDNAILGNRLGRPRRIVTTTPRPVKVVRELLNRDPSQKGKPPDPMVRIAPRMSTFDNMANLAPVFIKDLIKKYYGTRLGRQELMGELLLDVPGALWTLKMIERDRRPMPPLEDFVRIVVGVDPAVTSGENSAETGIIVCGRTYDDHFYVLRDNSGRVPAITWARRAIAQLRDFQGDRIVGEVNNGGDLIEAQLRIVDPFVSYKSVHASRGKRKRAEPVAALYEQRRVHHVKGENFDLLEDQMITWVPDADDEVSPDRCDAMVWAITELADLQEPTQIPTTQSTRSLR